MSPKNFVLSTVFVLLLHSLSAQVFAWGSNYYGTMGFAGADFSIQQFPTFEMFGEAKILDAGFSQPNYDNIFAVLLDDGTVRVFGSSATIPCSETPFRGIHSVSNMKLKIPKPVKRMFQGRTADIYLLQDDTWFFCSNTLAKGAYAAPVPMNDTVVEVVSKLNDFYFVTSSKEVHYQIAGDRGFKYEAKIDLTAAENTTLRMVSVGHDTAFFIMEDDTMYATGSNIFGQLGVDYNAEYRFHTPLRVPLEQVLYNNNAKVRGIKEMAHGFRSTILLTTDGLVYSCGETFMIGRDVNMRNLPNRFSIVEFTTSGPFLQATKVVSGIAFTLIITGKHVYGFGENDNSQLVAKTPMVLKPVRLPQLEKLTENLTTFCSSSSSRSVVAIVNNQLYQWGSVRFNNPKDVFFPTPIMVFEGVKDPTQVSAGMMHTLILGNALFAAGSNIDGALGIGVQQPFSDFIQVLLPDSLRKLSIKKVNAGFGISLVLTTNGKLFYFGTDKLRNSMYLDTPALVAKHFNFAEIDSFYSNVTIDDISEGFGMISALSLASEKLFIIGTGERIADATALRGETISKFQSGYGFTLILTTSGKLYAEGVHISSLFDTEKEYENKVEIVLNGVQDFTIGITHVLILLKNGTILGAGDNDQSQLCMPNQIYFTPARPLESVNALLKQKKRQIKLLSAGSMHSVFILDNEQIYQCGNMNFTQWDSFSKVEEVMAESPTLLPVPNIPYSTYEINSIVSGYKSNFIVVQDTSGKKVAIYVILGVAINSLLILFVIGLVSVSIILAINLLRAHRRAKENETQKDALLLDLLEERNSIVEMRESGDAKTISELMEEANLFTIDMNNIKNLKIIGEGASGSVLKGDWQHQQVAIKLLRTALLEGEDGSQGSKLAAVKHEVELLNSLKHPNIVCCFGICMKEPHIGIVMEYCAKGNLSQFIQKNKGKIDFDTKVDLLLQVAKGMNFLHTKNVIHRDLKSDNVLMDEHGVVKIADFGLAKSRADISRQVKSKMTRLIGTGVYMAPEVTMGEFYDEKCDVFSFAIIMFELLAETTNPYAENASGIELKVARNPTFRPILPESVNVAPGQGFYTDLMVDCWKHDLSARPSFSDVIERLQKHATKRSLLYTTG